MGRVVRAAFLIALLGPIAGCGYDRIQELDGRARFARTEIEVQLQRRIDLVPVLIETVRAQAAVDEDLVRAVDSARDRLSRAMEAGDVARMERYESQLSVALNGLLEVAGRSRGVQSDPGYRMIRAQLRATDAEFEEAVAEYNAAVAAYNEYIAEFPQLLTARVIRVERRAFFRPTTGSIGIRLGAQ